MASFVQSSHNIKKKYTGNQLNLWARMITGFESTSSMEADDAFRLMYENHNQAVLEYFGPERIDKDLLVFHLGWDSDANITHRLNAFLELDATKGIMYKRVLPPAVNGKVIKNTSTPRRLREQVKI